MPWPLICTALGAQHVPIETPSKHLTLDAEPHGEEFEVKAHSKKPLWPGTKMTDDTIGIH